MNKKEFVIVWTLLLLKLAFWSMSLFLDVTPVTHYICGGFTVLTLGLMREAYLSYRF